MRNVFWWILLGLAGMMQWGCDGFKRPIEVDYSDHITRGVIFSVMYTTDIRDSAFSLHHFGWSSLDNDQYNRIYISNSMPPVYSREDYYQADVHLMRGNEELNISFSELDSIFRPQDKYYAVNDDLIPGEEYQIYAGFIPDYAPVFVPEWAPVSARDTMPHLISFVIEDVQLEFEEGFEGRTPREGYMDIRIEDEVDRINEYLVDVSAIFPLDSTSAQESELVYGSIERPDRTADLDIFENSRDNLFYEDDFTKDGRKRIHFRFTSSYDNFDRDKGTTLIVRITNLSNSFRAFQKSAHLYTINQDNPFAEPVEIYSNVENGYGIFALAARSFQVAKVK